METYHFTDTHTGEPVCGAPLSSQAKVPGAAKSCTACTAVLKTRRQKVGVHRGVHFPKADD